MITSTPLLNKEDEKVVNMKLYVRYMVSLRCKTIVREELKKLGTKYSILSHGAIQFHEDVAQEDLNMLKSNLRKSGLELLDIHESKLVDRIINTIMEVVHNFDELPKLTYSELIAQNIGEVNESVLKIFSEVVGMSLIQFIVIQKVEKIKELLLYDDVPLSEITYKLRYKSQKHLIAQFKKHTGLTPAFFKQLRQKRLCNLEDL